MPIYVPDQNGDLASLHPTLAQTASDMPAGDLGAAFAKMCLSLVALIALLVVSYWFLKRLMQNRMQKNSENAAIHILEKRMISPKTMLYLIEVDKKKIVIAESQLEIKKISEDPLEK